LWEQSDLHKGEPRLEKFVQALARWPLTWRAALITGTLDGQPEEVFRVSGPSIWPFVAACGVTLMFIGELINKHLITGVGALVMLVAIIAWHWPEASRSVGEEEAAFEREHGTPVNAQGSLAVARWGMALTILIIWIALASFLFSYFFIRLENSVWPPETIAPPDLRLTLISAGLMLASGGAMVWSINGIRAGNQRHLRGGLISVCIAGAGALGIQIFDFTRLGFDWQTHAYGSLFYTVGIFLFLLVLSGLIMNALVLFWAWRGQYTARYHGTIQNAAHYWYSLVVAWLVTLATLYLTPYLT
jgi:cytochrome c oxidase subunit I+III